MKLSANTIGALLFTAAGIALFVLMANRMPEEGDDKSAMNFGMPIFGELVSDAVEEKVSERATPEVAPKTVESTTVSMPEAEPVTAEEPKVEESTAMPSTPPAEMKTEEIPTPPLVEEPAVEGNIPAN